MDALCRGDWTDSFSMAGGMDALCRGGWMDALSKGG